jgi:hypothetical protein
MNPASLLVAGRALSFRFPRQWTVAILLALLAPAASSQATGGLSGTVQDAAGATLSGAWVTLKLAESSVAYSSTITNHSGAFSFGTVRAASYELIVEAASFRDQRLTGVRIEPAVETALPPIRLSRGGPGRSSKRRLPNLPCKRPAPTSRFRLLRSN